MIPPKNIVLNVPDDWTVSVPDPSDIGDLTDLLRRHETAAIGHSSASIASVECTVSGNNEIACAHIMARDGAGIVRGWGSVHDRAGGRTLGAVTVDPDLADAIADPLAGTLYHWLEEATIQIGRERGLSQTHLDSGTFADDPRQRRWASAAGLTHVRSWWQMSRPVDSSEAAPGALPESRDEIVVRRVRRGPDGQPDELDLQIVHELLEASFADHFNSHYETFDEFMSRLRSDPGHRWDHWWIAETAVADAENTPLAQRLPAGTLIGTVAESPGEAPDGTHVEYLGVLQSARGHGAAKALLNAAITDAAGRGRDHVELEVDIDSPTGADGLYLALGFEPKYTTQSWHKNFSIDD